MKFGIRFKIISAYIGIIVLTLLAVGGVLLFVLQQNYLKSVKANLLHEARLVRENLSAQATTQTVWPKSWDKRFRPGLPLLIVRERYLVIRISTSPQWRTMPGDRKYRRHCGGGPVLLSGSVIRWGKPCITWLYPLISRIASFQV